MLLLWHELRSRHRDDNVYVETHKFGCKRGESINFSLCISPLNYNVFTFDILKLAQTLAGRPLWRANLEESDDPVRFPIRGIFVGCCA